MSEDRNAMAAALLQPDAWIETCALAWSETKEFYLARTDSGRDLATQRAEMRIAHLRLQQKEHPVLPLADVVDMLDELAALHRGGYLSRAALVEVERAKKALVDAREKSRGVE